MPVYLDNAASTPCDPRVLGAMMPYFFEACGNSLGKHAYGQAARDGIDAARMQVATLLGAKPVEIIFTGGASEANNLAIKGVASAFATKHPGQKAHFITNASEHKAVLVPMQGLENQGHAVTFLKPDRDGVIHAEQVTEAMREDTLLVSIMAANNEIGVINDIASIGSACRERGVLFHTDATQYVGKVEFNVAHDCIDMLSMTGHKMYGPKGQGALYIRDEPPVDIVPIIEGGGHEQGLRAGTLNTPGIVGLGMACELCTQELAESTSRVNGMRRRLEVTLVSALPGVRINGHAKHRLPNILNVCFESISGVALIDHITDIACTSGSAICSTDRGRGASHVLAGLGISDDLAATALRLSLGRFTTDDELDAAARHVIKVVGSLAG
ncbi:MAG: cysteine desulfurase family protein [Planctomycetota bacterium]|nr:cysteine desulfurase family protein [Planctomycetota bacterium]